MKYPKKIAILGFGIEGKSAKRFLRTKFPKATIEIRDKKIQPDYLKDLEGFDMVVRSPGVPYLLPEIQLAQRCGVIVSSVTNLFFEYARGMIVGITGTKGKGTTATMLLSILKSAGREAFLVGNIGVPMLSVLPHLSHKTTTIVELSSFQLQDLDVSPHIAVILEIAPDHQDYHHSMQEYVNAKSNIARHQKKKDTCIYIKRNTYARSIAQKSSGARVPVDISREGKRWEGVLTVPGHYNTYNAAVAAATARTLRVSDVSIEKGLKRFKGLPHHMEVVAHKNSVRYINDSASTNPVSTKAALESLDGEVVLIAGGVDKNFDYRVLAPVIAVKNVKALVLIGQNKNTIKRALPRVRTVFADSLAHALIEANRLVHEGGTILFSPASASFDMFKNSKDRGKQFSQLVKNT